VGHEGDEANSTITKRTKWAKPQVVERKSRLCTKAARNSKSIGADSSTSAAINSCGPGSREEHSRRWERKLGGVAGTVSADKMRNNAG
jgi:hypothetical protein